MLSQLFNDKTYQDKVKSVTNLRLISFFIWKFILGLIFYYFLTKFTQNYYISSCLLSEIKFYFSIYDYTALFVLLFTLDFLKYLVFENYEENVSNSELVVKIILDPGRQTIFILLNSILMLFILKNLIRNGSSSYKTLTKKRKSENLQEIHFLDDELHLILYSVLNSIIFIFKQKNFRWSQIFVNRIFDLKLKIKEFLKKKWLKISLINISFFVLVVTFGGVINNLSLNSIGQIFNNFSIFKKDLTLFIFSTLTIEFINYVSYFTLKTILCTPINPSNNKNSDVLIMVKHEFSENSRFLNLHYIQNLIYVYESTGGKITYTKYPSNFLTSKDAMLEFKSKMNKMFDEFSKKVIKLNSPPNKKDPGMADFIYNYLNYNFQFSEIFTKNTSFKMLDYGTKLISLLIFNFIKQIEFGMDGDQFYSDSEYRPRGFESSPSKTSSSQHYILYLLETLINFENNLNDLLKNQKYYDYSIKYKYLCKEIQFLKNVVNFRISEIIKRNFKQNFLINYGESVKIKMQQLIS